MRVWTPPTANTKDLSRAVFGSAYMLPVLAAIARLDDPFTYWDVVNESGVQYPEVRNRLAKLDKAGLVCRLPLDIGQVHWSAMPSPLWGAAQTLFAPSTTLRRGALQSTGVHVILRAYPPVPETF